MHAFWLWLLVHLGIDDTGGPWYAFWSGFGSDLVEVTLIGSLVAAYKHHQCHKDGCWRLGHIDPHHGFPACRHHHSRRERLERSQEDRA